MSERLGLRFDLNIGVKIGSNTEKEIHLLESNSIAEEVFTRKLAQEPFTYIANVITIATGSIGTTNIAEAAREEYFKTGKITIPQAVKNIPFADANTMLLEIHRRVWQHEFKDMPTTCRFCTKDISVDVDLNKCKLDAKYEEILENEEMIFDGISCELTPFSLDRIMQVSKNEEVTNLVGTMWNQMVFRIPTLGDAIKNEDYFDKNIDLWRRIGADCLIGVNAVDADGNVTASLPTHYIKLLGLKIYKDLLADNLRKIRHALREELPVLPFAYTDICACDLRKKIPHTVDSSGFFSESL